LKVRASAPGKVILFGEHSVVYRGPAIAMAIDRRVSVYASPRRDLRIRILAPDIGVSGYFERQDYFPLTGGELGHQQLLPVLSVCRSTINELGMNTGLDVEIRSELPMGVGLGSSAALSVAAVTAIDAIAEAGLTQDKIVELSMNSERLIHGTPSGIDSTVATLGGIIIFEQRNLVERLRLPEIPTVVGNTGIQRLTGRLIGDVRKRLNSFSCIDKVIDAIADVAVQGRSALIDGDLLRMGELMTINHGLLWALGVSTPELDRLVNSSLKAGAVGAKLTGAGGGGCMIAVCRKQDVPSISHAIAQSQGYPLEVRPSEKGVIVTKET